jgi:hypothetical protein
VLNPAIAAIKQVIYRIIVTECNHNFISKYKTIK